MAVTEDRRIALLEAAHHHWGRDVAVTLIEMFPPSGWGEVATRQRVDALERTMELRFQLVDQRFGALEAKLDTRIAGLEVELDALEVRLGTRIDGLETKVDGIDLRLGARIDALAGELHGELATMRHEMQAGFATLEARTIRWIAGTGVALLGALSGLGGLLLALH